MGERDRALLGSAVAKCSRVLLVAEGIVEPCRSSGAPGALVHHLVGVVRPPRWVEGAAVAAHGDLGRVVRRICLRRVTVVSVLSLTTEASRRGCLAVWRPRSSERSEGDDSAGRFPTCR